MTTQVKSLNDPLRISYNTQWVERATIVVSLLAVDLAMVLLGFWLAYQFRFETSFTWFYQHNQSPLDFYRWIVFLMVPLWLVVFALFGLYDAKNLFSGMREYMYAFNACTLSIMLIIFFSFFDPDFVIARGWVVLSWVLVSFLVGLGRFTVRRVVQRMRLNGRLITTVLIVGANEEAQAIAQQMQSNPRAGVKVVGFASNEHEKGIEISSGLLALGSINNLPSLVKKYGAQEVVVASTAVRREELLNLFQTVDMMDVPIRLSSGLYELLTTGVEVHEVANVPLMSINKVRLAGMDVILKRTLDLVVAGTVFLATLPLMALMFIIIKLDSPGPVFYLRRVVGVGGQPFDAFKFRTMYVDAEERLNRDPELRREFEENFKLKNDPRITRVGKFLRAVSMDELPQLLNVIRGEMSLVGPRMITEPERARYGKWQTNLTTVKPGVTGLWQVSGRSDVSYEERVRLDMQYIRNYTIWLDLHLLIQTIPAVLKRRGAY